MAAALIFKELLPAFKQNCLENNPAAMNAQRL
jgi:hypothetical protein